MALKQRRPVVVRPGAGRKYPMGPVAAVFKADGEETAGRYSISEWWLKPFTKGPGAHQHDEDDVFFVLEGTMSFFLAGEWVDAPKGSLVVAPAGMPHDFENRTSKPVGALNVCVPGDFEPHMKGIAEWFRLRSAAASRTENAPRRRGAKPFDIDGYLASVQPDRRAALQKLRRTIHESVPGLEECISYSIPAFRQGGRVVAGFCATAKGCSYFPFSGSTLKTLARELSGYSQTKSALHFDPARGLPPALVKKLLRARISEKR